jgi:hypothetical protein
MIEVIYASAEAQPFSANTLADLLVKARENNHALGVSGLLLNHKGSFLQVLEGEEPVVDALFQMIGKDPRHTRMMIIKRRSISQRSFGEWSMGFVLPTPATLARKLDGFNRFLQSGALPTAGAAEGLCQILYGFRTGQWRQHLT